MNTAIVSMAIGDEYREIVGPALETHREYTDALGVDYHCATVSDTDRPPSWFKIRLLQRVLPAYDWIWWLDADALVMVPSIDLRDLIDRYGKPYCWAVVARDKGGAMNFGSLFVKRCDYSFEILDRIWARERYVDHCLWEQQAFQSIYDEDAEVRRRTVVVKNGREFNAFDHGRFAWQPGDFVCHVSGARGTQLRDRIKHYYQLRGTASRGA